ncbi:MAG: DEAD/DEAH box helicase, partial [Candidatus Peribacteraceae bacterium]|nr:DEAD/DEAH box helicase [Candidatus Peribacteraceae bacterium]
PEVRRHQIATSDFLTKYNRAFCFNDIGTGKTLSLLWAADFLMKIGMVRRVLILSTLSTLWNIWDDEIFMTLPYRKSIVLHGPKQQRINYLNADRDFYILNHDGVKVLWQELIKREDIDLIIVDEGAEFSNSRTSKWSALDTIIGIAENRNKLVWWATGSPMPNAPTDAWGQARLVNPSTVPKFFTHFRNQVMAKDQNGIYRPMKGWEEFVFNAIQPSIRFVRDECIDIPPCVTEERKVPMSKDQGEAYKELETEYVLEIGDGKITAVNEGVKLGKLLQIASGAIYDKDKFTHYIKCKPKLQALMDCVKEAGGKAIIFAPFTHSIFLLERLLEKDYNVRIVYSKITPKQRTVIYRDFKNGLVDIIIAHPRCMAHGLNLTESHVVIWWSPIDSFRIYEQANGRITRDGQTVPQTIFRLVCSKVESMVYKRIDRKEKMQGIILELLRNGVEEL